MGALEKAGIDVLAITAEPGGEEAIRKRLTEREVPTLSFPIRSDPDHTFLTELDTPNDIFTFKDHEWDVSGNYNMVQPALVVYDDAGKVIPECTWSWKTMGYKEDSDWDTRVPTGGDAKALLVTYRPDMEDLVAAAQENRAVKLASTNPEW